MSAPFVSVIVPAHKAAHLLPDTLGALMASDLPRDRWELIVIDDCSSDDTALVAAEYADTLVRLSGWPHGPSFARNRGVEVSNGDLLVFVDSDVRIHPTALRGFVELFEAEPDLGAAFGSYDDKPPAPSFVSRYRNLLHHYHHHRNRGEAGTFWAGLGAIRTSVFNEVDKYDEWRYERPQIEDIELGRRIRLAGYRIRLDPTIQGTHLKHWKLGDILKTDLLHRGIPWMRLMLREGGGGDTLNVTIKEKACVALLGFAIIAAFLAAVLTQVALLGVSAALVAAIVLWNTHLYSTMAGIGGWGFGVAVIPLHLTYYLISGLAAVGGHLLHLRGAEPQPSDRTLRLTAEGVVSWPPVPVPPRSSVWDKGAA